MRKLKIQGFYSFTALASIIPLIVMLLITLYYIDRQETLHQRELVQNAGTNICSSLEDTMEDIQTDTLSFTTSMDYLVFCNSSEKARAYKAGHAVLDTLQTHLQAYPEVIGAFLYNSPSGQMVSHYAYTNLALYREQIAGILKAPAEITGNSWETRQFGDTSYICFTLRRRYGHLLIVLDPKRSERYAAYALTFQGNARFYFCNSPAEEAGSTAISARVQPLDLYLICQMEASGTAVTVQFFFWLIILFFFLVAIGQILLFQRKVIRPFQEISASLKKIADGDLSYRVRTTNALPDIQKVSENINDMLQKIQAYKEEGFRLRMDAIQAKLQFYQLQIKPHFYLNCLKSVNALLNLHEYENARTLVLTLSNYITHTFGDTRNFIPFRSELEAVQSYVLLRNLTFSMDIQLHFQIDGPCVSARCLPMSILTFVENSIKHAEGKKNIGITICAKVEQRRTGPSMTVSIEDTGKGFSDAFLQEQQKADPSQMVYRKSQIGISNIRYRLWLTYENRASLTLQNQNGHAKVTLQFPYEAMKEDDIL